MTKGFAKADRTRTEVPGKRKKPSKAVSSTPPIPTNDRTEREEVIARLRNRGRKER